MSDRINYPQNGPGPTNDNIATNITPEESNICSQCGRIIITPDNLQYFGIIGNQAANLSTTVPMINGAMKNSDDVNIDDIAGVILSAESNKKSLLSKASSKRSKKCSPSKTIKKKKKSCKFKIGRTQMRAVLERENKVKKLMQQSVTTAKKSDDESNAIDIDSSIYDFVNKTKIKDNHKKKICKSGKIGKVYQMRLSNLTANSKAKAKKPHMVCHSNMSNKSIESAQPEIKQKLCRKRNKRKAVDISIPKKDMGVQSVDCNKGIDPDEPKKKVRIQDHCKPAITSSQKKCKKKKKKKVQDGYCYVIETTTPLPYGTYVISVDKNSIMECGSSEVDVSDCSCDECQASTSLDQKKYKRCSNKKAFARRYKNKSACKRTNKHRR